jgi:hypothetical protein
MLDVCITTPIRTEPAPGEYHFPKLERAAQFRRKLRESGLVPGDINKASDPDRDTVGFWMYVPAENIDSVLDLIDRFYGADAQLDISARFPNESQSFNPRTTPRHRGGTQGNGTPPPAPCM